MYAHTRITVTRGYRRLFERMSCAEMRSPMRTFRVNLITLARTWRRPLNALRLFVLSKWLRRVKNVWTTFVCWTFINNSFAITPSGSGTERECGEWRRERRWYCYSDRLWGLATAIVIYIYISVVRWRQQNTVFVNTKDGGEKRFGIGKRRNWKLHIRITKPEQMYTGNYEAGMYRE